ncbi:MAG TPA: penicillin-binding protein 2, partial [Gammaproteobacteria bacterium]|nr:penicillin-binding protein 2 [Gammaproteobacteria bacterium]
MHKRLTLINKRIWVAGGIVIVLTALLLWRLAYLQISKHDLYTTLSQQNVMELLPIAPNRGLIYDRNGVLLAKNIPVFSLDITPDQVKNLDQTIQRLQKMIPISEDEISTFKKALKQQQPFEKTPLKMKLTDAQVAQFYVNQYYFPGVSISARMMRYYPLGNAMADVLGYVARINAQDLASVNKTNYSASNYIGKIGIEKYYESELHGTVGYQQVEINAGGQIVRVLKRTAPIPGENLYLSIDSNLQLSAEEALGDQQGAIVAIQPNTGEVLALVSKPSYNPNTFVTGIDAQQFAELQNSPSNPLYNRAIRGQYPIASTIKPFLALEGLDSGVVTPTTSIYDKGWFRLPNTTHIYHDYQVGGHGWVNMTKAIIVSCDTYFYSLSVQLGIARIDDILERFGFGRHTGIDMNEELPGLVPSPWWKLKSQGLPWYTGDTIETDIGQGFMLATPLQLAMAT